MHSGLAMALHLARNTFLRRLALSRATCRFRRDQRGAAAIEFGLLAIPFFALLFAILQVGLVFFAGQSLETAVANTARLVRTGQAQQLGYGATDLTSQICSQVSALFTNCTSNLKLDVRTFATFDSVDLSKPVDVNGNLLTNFTYAAGHGSDIVVIRAFYEWPVFTKLLSFNLSNLTDGNHLLASVAAFRNEPFPW
jgi:Flp pilus assembly protein TadG